MNKIDRRRVLLGGAAVTAAAACDAQTPSFAHETSDGPIGAWTPLERMPSPVQEIYPAPFWKAPPNGGGLKPDPFNIIVNAGGLTTRGQYNVTDEVTFYDPIYNRWGFGTPLPEARHHIALVNNNGYLYGVGGFARDDRGGWQMRSNCWRMGEVNGEWFDMATLPHPQAETVCLSLDGYIHVAGGRAPAGSLNQNWADHIDTDEHWVYDAASNQWFPAAPMPTARNSAAGAVVRGVLYVIGGRTVSDGNLTTVEVYDPLSDRWERAAPMPKAQAGLAASVLNGKIYVFGGEYFNAGGGGVFAEAWEYNPREDKWRAVAAMPRPRHGLGAVSLGDAIYVLGGAARAGGADTSDALDKFEI